MLFYNSSGEPPTGNNGSCSAIHDSSVPVPLFDFSIPNEKWLQGALSKIKIKKQRKKKKPQKTHTSMFAVNSRIGEENKKKHPPNVKQESE